MLLPPFHIPLAPLPLCFHTYSNPTRLVLHGDARPLAGGQCLWGVLQAPGRTVNGREIQSQQQVSTNQLTAMDSDTDLAMKGIWHDIPSSINW